MVARIPLIVNSSAEQIQELPSGDSINIPGDLNVTGTVTGSALHAVQLTADGAIGVGTAVVLTSAGKVKAISTGAESFGSASTFFTHSDSEQVNYVRSLIWDTSQNAALLAWGNDSKEEKVSSGTLSGTTITWSSTHTELTSSIDSSPTIPPAIATNNNGGGVAIYVPSSSSNSAARGLFYKTFTLSGSTVTWGTESVISAYVLNENQPDRPHCIYLEEDGGSHYFLISYRKGDPGSYGQKGKMRILKWDGQNNVTLGAETDIEGTNATENATRDAIRPVLVPIDYGRFLYYDGDVSGPGWKIASRLGTTIVDKSAKQSAITGGPGLYDNEFDGSYIVYDPISKYLYSVTGGQLAVLTIDYGAIIFRFKIDLPSGAAGQIGVTDKGQVIHTYMTSMFGNGQHNIGTLNGERNRITWSSATTWSTNAGNHAGGSHLQPRIVKVDDGKFIYAYFSGSGNNEDGKAIVFQAATTTLTPDNFLGFSAAGYSDGNTASISVLGSQTTQSGLTTTKKYYVQDNGTIGIGKSSFGVVAGKALSTTKLLITPV